MTLLQAAFTQHEVTLFEIYAPKSIDSFLQSINAQPQ